MRSDIKLILDLSVINSDKILDSFLKKGIILNFTFAFKNKQTWNEFGIQISLLYVTICTDNIQMFCFTFQFLTLIQRQLYLKTTYFCHSNEAFVKKWQNGISNHFRYIVQRFAGIETNSRVGVIHAIQYGFNQFADVGRGFLTHSDGHGC